MTARLSVLLSVFAAALALAVPASANPVLIRIPLKHLLLIQQGSALAEVVSRTEVPTGWSSDAIQAEAAAEHTQTLQALHGRYAARCGCAHPLEVSPFVWRSQKPYWYIAFSYRGDIVAEANVSQAGKVIGVWTGAQARAPYTHGGYPWPLDAWALLVPGSLLFLLAFFDPRRLLRMAHLDALAVLAFLVSYLLLAAQHLESSVWLAYPPLLYLLARLLWIGTRPRAPAGRLAPLLSTRTLLIGLPILLAVRIAVSFAGHQEIDVGYESVIGAFRILHHLPIYYNDPNHGDTYGPVTYLLYVPFELVFPWTNSLSNLHAADAAAIFFDLGTVASLIWLGRRIRPGSAGTRLGLVLGWAWAACPFATLNLIVHTNDGLIALLTVLALIAITSPVLSGVLLGLATAAKFSPASLVPLFASPRQRGWRGAAILVVSFAVIVAVAIYSWLPPGGFHYFWLRTIHYQIVRPDVFSPWALHPGLKPLQTVLEVFAVLLALAVALVPGERSLARVGALAGAVTIAIQLPATHWFYYYIVWFLPFLLVAVLAPLAAPEAATETEAVRQRPHGQEPPRPALAEA